MDLKRTRKRHLSTLHTARLFASLMLLSGFVMIVASLFLPLLPELLAKLGTVIQSATAQVATEPAATGQVTTEAGPLPLAVPEWINSWSMFLMAILLLWAGYLLKTLVVLAETQMVE